MNEEFDFKQLIGYNNIIYGESGTGKSTVIRQILSSFKGHIPICVVISPTEDQNQTYKDLIPDYLIISSINTQEKLKIKLNKILNRQKKITKNVKLSQDSQTIEDLLQMLRDYNNIDQHYDQIINGILSDIQQCENEKQKVETDKGIQKENRYNIIIKLQKSQEKFQEKLNNIKREIIINNQEALQEMKLSESQQVAVQYMTVNPNLLLILDDCGSILDTQLQKDTVFKDLFYNGRHSNTTTLIAVQNDKTVSPSIRQQAFFSMFCSPSILEYFMKGNNGIDAKTAKHCINQMRSNPYDNLRCIYARQTNEMKLIKSYSIPKFLFCDPIVADYCQFIKNSQSAPY